MTNVHDIVAADIDAFIDPDGFFGESIQRPDLTTFNAIVLDGFDEVDDPRSPQIVCKDSDVDALTHGDALTRVATAVVYTIEGHQPGPAGMTILQMAPT